jgi:hypothetical protein
MSGVRRLADAQASVLTLAERLYRAGTSATRSLSSPGRPPWHDPVGQEVCDA